MRLLKPALVAYVVVIALLAVICFWPGTDHERLYVVLWLLCMPSSIVSGPVYEIVVVLTGGSVITHMGWWILVSCIQAGLLFWVAQWLINRKAATRQGRL